MSSPFPPSTSQSGQGLIHLALLPPSTPTFSNLAYTYPLKLVPSTPHTIPTRSQDHNAALASENTAALDAPKPTTCPLLFMLTYGGGLLAGDNICLTIQLDVGTRLTITTQGMTKVFRPSSPSCTDPLSPSASVPAVSCQTLDARINAHAALWLAPDPVQPFAESHYAQRQVFEVEKGGSVGLVDWVVEGRKARGEIWDLGSWRGRNEIWNIYHPVTGRTQNVRSGYGRGEVQKKRLLVRDAVKFEQPGLREKMDGMGVFGTVILRGPLFRSLAGFFVEEFDLLPRIGGRNWSPSRDAGLEQRLSERERWRKGRIEKEKEHGVLWTACHVRECTIVKFMAPGLEDARHWLGSMLKEEGTVCREFGEGGVMFVR